MAIRVVVMGSGTSTGVPVLGCSCEVCQSKDSRNNRTRASVLIEHENGLRVVIDTGADFRMQMLRNKVSSLEHVLYTHCHADHMHGFDDLRGLYFNNQKPIFCYLDSENAKELRHRFYYAFENSGYLGGIPDIRLIDLPSGGGRFLVEGLEFETIRLPHGNVMTNAFRFGNFAYATDFKSFPQDCIERWRGKIHTMVASGLRWREHLTHSTINETLLLFEKLGVKKGIVSHLSHEVEYERDSVKMPPGIELAYDGLTFTVE